MQVDRSGYAAPRKSDKWEGQRAKTGLVVL